MAAIAATNIIQIDLNRGAISQIDGWPVEQYRIIGPFVAGDTALIKPNRFKYVKDAVIALAVSNLPLDSNLPAPTNVTFTMRGSAAINQSVDVFLTGKQGG